MVKEGSVKMGDLDDSDVFLLDDAGRAVWVWEGESASAEEKRRWLSVAQAYVRQLTSDGDDEAWRTPVARVVQGQEGRGFMKAITA